MGATTATGAADRRRTTLTAAVLAAGLALACGGDGGSDAAPDAGAAVAGEAEACGPLEIVVVNDDGVGSPALDLLAERLTADDRFEAEVTIVVPAGERSGTGDATTPGGAPHDEAATPGGAPARAVDGYPADAVAVALDDLALDPHLVVSGINLGQNVGPLVDVSGTIGAARTALRRGVPRWRSAPASPSTRPSSRRVPTWPPTGSPGAATPWPGGRRRPTPWPASTCPPARPSGWDRCRRFRGPRPCAKVRTSSPPPATSPIRPRPTTWPPSAPATRRSPWSTPSPEHR